MAAPISLSLTEARRLAVAAQHLSGPPRPSGSPEDLLGLVRDLGCLQLDPTSVVERTHLLVLWSRLGPFDRQWLEALRWDQRRLFEYFAHAASIVLTEDYPLYLQRMRHQARKRTGWAPVVREWMRANAGFKRYIVGRLRAQGPLRSRDFEDRAVVPWESDGWTHGRNVNRMLEFMWYLGELVVAGRSGATRWWDLADRWLPEWTPRERLGQREVTRRAIDRSLRALGVATARQIREHFTRGYYPELPAVLNELERNGQIVRAEVDGVGNGDPWFVHLEDIPTVEAIRRGERQPRTVLLSPFDNLICDRARTEQLFGFHYRIGIYTPKAQRQFGYFAMPILHGDRLIGWVDPRFDRPAGRLVADAVQAEPDSPGDAGPAVAGSVRDLASFVGAQEVEYAGPIPAQWVRHLG